MLDQHEVLGIDRAVLAATSDEQFASADAVDGLAADVESIREDLRGRGWDLQYHNHDVDWFIYEHDPEDPIASIEHDATVLESLR